MNLYSIKFVEVYSNFSFFLQFLKCYFKMLLTKLSLMLHSSCYVVDPPGKPGKPEIVDYDKDRAEIKWTPPASDGGSPISKYVIEKKEKGLFWQKVIFFN